LTNWKLETPLARAGGVFLFRGQGASNHWRQLAALRATMPQVTGFICCFNYDLAETAEFTAKFAA
jgi:hypothetical protein